MDLEASFRSDHQTHKAADTSFDLTLTALCRRTKKSQIDAFLQRKVKYLGKSHLSICMIMFKFNCGYLVYDNPCGNNLVA